MRRTPDRAPGRSLAILLACLVWFVPCAAWAADGGADGPAAHGDAHADHAAHAAAGESPAGAGGPAQASPATVPAAGPAQAVPAGVGVTERLGQSLPADIVLTDETGAPVALRDLLTIPTLIAPVYFSCPTDCNILLGTLSQILPQVGLSPGREYQVLAVSFDERDTPALAAQKQREFLTAMQAPFPPAGWRFLSADLPTIRRLMDGLGFGFVREGATFRHPVVTIAVSPQGRITRYLYGSRPLPFDIALAATEAAGDKVGFSVKRAVAMCYSYDPASRRYVFDLMRVAGFSVLFAIGLFALFLAFGGKKKPRS